MKKTLYSQFALLALANREWKRPHQPLLQGEGRRSTRVTRRAEHEPEHPREYRHICGAINALMAAEADWESGPSHAGGYRDRVLDRIHEALAELLSIRPERTPLLSLLPSSLATSLLPERASDSGRRYQAEGDGGGEFLL